MADNETLLPFADTDLPDDSSPINPIPFTIVNNQPLDNTPFIAPYVPCTSTTILAALEFVKVNENDILVDLGCGDGRILSTALETDHPPKQALGVELDPYLCSYIRETVLPKFNSINSNSEIPSPTSKSITQTSNAKECFKDTPDTSRFVLLEGDMFNIDLRSDGLNASVLVLYLLPRGLEKLKTQLQEWLQEEELESGSELKDYGKSVVCNCDDHTDYSSIKNTSDSESTLTLKLKKSIEIISKSFSVKPQFKDLGGQKLGRVHNCNDRCKDHAEMKMRKGRRRRICTITYSIPGWEPIWAKPVLTSNVGAPTNGEDPNVDVKTGEKTICDGAAKNAKKLVGDEGTLYNGSNLGVAGTSGIHQWLFYYDIDSVKME